MKSKAKNKTVLCVLVALMPLLLGEVSLLPAQEGETSEKSQAEKVSTPGGQLWILDKAGKQQVACPLAHTDVQADIAGFISRVRVRQTFHNPLSRKIEAVYVFPLPNDSAVDEMTMTVGNRRIKGQIKPREEARKTYEDAKAKGHVASLLDQERPNIFSQAVANIEPGAEVVIEIAYTETLKWKDGVYEWVFPTVVGPRYMPGEATGKDGVGWSPDTTRVPDASKISPSTLPPTMRSGHDISLQVRISTGAGEGMAVREIESKLHPVKVGSTPRGATVSLANENEIPNRDFVLRYKMATEKIGDSFLTHSDPRGTFFTLILQPPARVTRKQAVPRELVFVLDTSGSMSGFPLEKAKQVMDKAIDEMGSRDEFNLITFAGDTRVLWESPRPATSANRKLAQQFLNGQSGGGGTEMMKAINAALESQDENRVRIVCFMTDGYVGNDMEIVGAIKKNAKKARVFSFGIGNSVNRFLLDEMARAGRGEAEFVTLANEGDAAATRFFEKINAPVLTDIAFDWGKLPVEEIYPNPQRDLFSNQPIMIHGRMKKLQNGTFTIKGKSGDGNWERRVRVNADEKSASEALPSLWARAKVAALMDKDMASFQNDSVAPELKAQITKLGVDFHLMTQFTSFVAAEERIVTKGDGAEKVGVPVEMPDGVSYEGTFGESKDSLLPAALPGGSYSVGSGSRFASRAGDPLIIVDAPENAAQVVAVLPGGEVKKLTFDPLLKKWQAHFDIPTYALDGEYSIKVVIVEESGARRALTLNYHVDSTPPTGSGATRLGENKIHLSLDVSSDTKRVEAILADGRRVELFVDANEPNRFARDIAIAKTKSKAAREGMVTFILTDSAHNRTTIQVDMSR